MTTEDPYGGDTPCLIRKFAWGDDQALTAYLARYQELLLERVSASVRQVGMNLMPFAPDDVLNMVIFEIWEARQQGTLTSIETRDEFMVIFERTLKRTIARLKAVLVDRLPALVFDPELGSVAGWVVKIAWDMARKHAPRRWKSVARSLTPELANGLPDPSLGPEIENVWALFNDDLRQIIDSLRNSLSERDHRITVMRFVEDCSVSQIAGALELTEACVASVLHRVNPKLRDLLDRTGSAICSGTKSEKNGKIVQNSERLAGSQRRILLDDSRCSSTP